jgi:hypothetical protein
MSDTEPDDADPKTAESIKLGVGDQILVSVKPQQPICARTKDTDHGPPPGIVSPSSGLGGHVGLGGRSKPPQPGPLSARTVDELDPWVGPEFAEENAIGGIVGVED